MTCAEAPVSPARLPIHYFMMAGDCSLANFALAHKLFITAADVSMINYASRALPRLALGPVHGVINHCGGQFNCDSFNLSIYNLFQRERGEEVITLIRVIIQEYVKQIDCFKDDELDPNQT